MTTHSLSLIARPRLRLARHDDMPEITTLVARSVSTLMDGHYLPREVAAMRSFAHVHPQLIDDRTYFVAELNGMIAGCGGWSFRPMATGYAKDAHAARLVPPRDRALFRAFYTDPAFARRGIARLLLTTAERAAAEAGFRMGELIATLIGATLYRAAGWTAVEDLLLYGDRDTPVPAIRMRKRLAAPAHAFKRSA